MAEEIDGGKLIAALQAAGEKYADIVTGIQSSNDSPDEKNRKIMELAKKLTMKPGGRAEEYLDHFLDGSGNDKHFMIQTLIAEDSAVSTRLATECVRRCLGLKTWREQRRSARMTPDPDLNKYITIFQKTYANRDWAFALGTFNFEYALVNVSDDAKRIFVRLSGDNTYRWHPEENRITKFIHQAADSLVKSGSAKNFKIVAIPAVLVFSVLNRDLLSITSARQYNPDNSEAFGGVTAGKMFDAASDAVQERVSDEISKFGRRFEKARSTYPGAQ